ncbi:MFS transporter [Roseateles asaccharophilus]|uniref:ACS family hexuronate transporter-like MFS transporter n=1 Tax=Roseateles asaccharophilus TaxID=582607 RepID=A0ABU2A236_9BURK|nr:MFS transporter [Roseateles asaccharophilus]MDR7331253.1 ACS family hexuronate transporter-like MFS transporter [Roseateles asaccharophilus]
MVQATAAALGRQRWWICALLFIATTINYIDRNALSVLKTSLQQPLEAGGLALTDADYGWITFAFTAAYAAFPPLIGTAIDRFGVKRSLAVALILWSLASAAHGLVATVLGFVIVRFLLGMAEAAHFPAAIKAVAMWFPQQERALATGLFNSGTALGIIASPLTVWLALTFGWQSAFIAIGAAGLLWLVFWQRGFHAPEQHPQLSAAELSHIRAGQPPAAETVRLPWTALLRYRQIWPFLLGKLLTDPVWWFFLFWLPSYLERERGQNPLKSAGLVALIYLGSSVGSIFGGWLSGHLTKRGWPVGQARMVTMGIFAACMPASILAYWTDSFAICVALITLATACHQAWSANLMTSATDLFPIQVSGAVIGLGATAGGIGGMFITLLTALTVQWTGTQQWAFVYAGAMHLTSLAIFWLWFRGRFERVNLASGLDLTRRHRGLLTAGGVLALLGLVLVWLITANWQACVAAAKFSGAAQALTAAIGLGLIGALLTYAGRSHRGPASLLPVTP